MTLTRSITLAAVTLVLAACDSGVVTAPDVAVAPFFAKAHGPRLATGSGHVPSGSGMRVFTFHAKDQGNGTATGSYRINLTGPDLFFEVDVTCLAIEGNTAWVAGIISDTNAGFIEVGTVSYFYAIDNGEGAGSAPDIITSARINDIDGEDLLFCRDRPLLLPEFEIERGNVQVR